MTEVMERAPSQSRVEMTQLVLPGDANTLGNAFGGKVMQWIDVAAGVAARRHCGGVAVTASIDSLVFLRPIRLSDVVVLRASVNRSWHTSMEIGVRVECDGPNVDEPQRHVASAFLTFVSIDEQGRPKRVPRVKPQTADEIRRFEEADQRRLARLARREAGDPEQEATTWPRPGTGLG